jgi:hypothetical protein
MANLDGERVEFSAREIPEDVFLYLAGMECGNPAQLKPADVAAAQLKIWGVYRGGTTEATIREAHRLTPTQFRRLARRKLRGELIVQDNGQLSWNEKRGGKD